MIKYSPQDYVIVEQGPKKHLVIATTVDADSSRGILEHSRVTGENQILEFSADQVVTTLGPKPKIGTVHGVRVEPWFRSFPTAVGDCDLYFKPQQGKAFKTDVEKCADEVHDQLTDWKLAHLAPVQFEMRAPKGKNTTGMYQSGKGRGETDLIICRTHDTSLLPYLLVHEFGHSIWFKHISPEVKVRWIKKYMTGVAITHVTAKTCRALLSDMLEFEDGRPSEYGAQLEEEDAAAYAACLGWIEQHHGLRSHDLDLLYLESEMAALEEVWPPHVTVSDMQALVTEYGRKNVDELWCEALANYAVGKLGKDMTKMVERTLGALR